MEIKYFYVWLPIKKDLIYNIFQVSYISIVYDGLVIQYGYFPQPFIDVLSITTLNHYCLLRMDKCSPTWFLTQNWFNLDRVWLKYLGL